MSSGDETYLESFIESLGTLGYEVKRNLDLVRDLDDNGGASSSSSSDLQTLQTKHADYVAAAEEKLLQLQVVQGKVRVPHSPNQLIVPTTDELMQYVHNEDKWKEIVELQENCLQKADEKYSVAQQAYELIDAQVARLDDDLMEMEKLLEVGCRYALFFCGCNGLNFAKSIHS